MSRDYGLRFLYHTVPGRVVLKALTSPAVSKAAGAFLDTKASALLIPGFQRRNGISLEGIQVPEGGFSSFNAFFSRKRAEGEPMNHPGELISPCDGLLSCIPIQGDTVLHVKHTAFSLGELLQDRELAKDYEGGWALVFRLTPAHYHRYGFAVDGCLAQAKVIPGILHCVRPIATERFPVYTQNSRTYRVIKSADFGQVVQMEVGAMLVGRIANHTQYKAGDLVRAGEEKGYFEYGGSTIILLVEAGRLQLMPRLRSGDDRQGEIPVKKGEQIAERSR